MPCVYLAEVVLVQCNLVDNQHQHKFEVLYTFAANKSYAYLHLFILMLRNRKQI